MSTFPKRMPAASAAGQRAALAPSSISAWLALTNVRCDTPHQPPCDVVTLDVSERTVRPGDRLRTVVSVRPVAMAGGAALYLGVTLSQPDVDLGDVVAWALQTVAVRPARTTEP